MSAPQRPLNGEQILQRIDAGSTGRDLIAADDAATARAELELGTAALNDAGDFDAAGAAASAQDFAIQRANHTGTQAPSTISIAENSIILGDAGNLGSALATGAKGRELIAAADAAAARAAIDAQQQNDGLDYLSGIPNLDDPVLISGRKTLLAADGWEALNYQEAVLATDHIWIGDSAPGAPPVDFATGAKGRDLLAAADAAAARSAIDLGTAATATLTTSATDTTEGRVTRVGDFGIGESPVNTIDYDAINVTGFFRNTDNSPVGAPFTRTNWAVISLVRDPDNRRSQIAVNNSEDVMYFRRGDGGSWSPWREIYHDGNVTIDGNGFLKEASPIIRLYTDSIDQEQHDGATLEHPETGVYRISGTEGFAQTGWYIENYKDANGNIKAFVEYECTDGVIEVRTYEPTGTGWRAEKGEPMDIHGGRYITIRLHKTEDVSDEL